MSGDDELIEVTFVNHSQWMTRAEAAALTDSDRAAYEAFEDEFQAERQAVAAVETEALERARAAAAEKGRIVLEVWCARCKQQQADRVAVVRLAPKQGCLVFEGWAPELPEAEHDERKRRLRSMSGQWVEFAVRGWTTVLLDDGPPDEQLHVGCLHGHGEVHLSLGELRRRVRDYKGMQPVKLTINDNGTVLG